MSTVNAFFAKEENAGAFAREYGFYWERSVKDETGRVIKTEDWSHAERKDAAKNGEAMPDGSFPIKKVKDVKDAVDDWSRAGSKPTVKDHIKSRAKALDASHHLPDDWQDKGATNADTNADTTVK